MAFIITLKRWWQRSVLWLSLLFVVALITVPLALFVWLLFFTPIFTVQAITIVDARPSVEDSAKELLSGLIGKNIFFVLPDVHEKRIAAELPSVRTAHLTLKLPSTVKVVIQEKTPALLLLTGGDYYFVDRDGVVYEQARLDTLPGIVLPVVKNTDTQTTRTVTFGVPVMERSFVDFIAVIQEQLPEHFGVRVGEIRIPSLSAREVTFVLDNNWLIRFDTGRSAEQQLAVLEQLLDHTIADDERNTLDYVDLRIPNRVYYRTRGGEVDFQ